MKLTSILIMFLLTVLTTSCYEPEEEYSFYISRHTFKFVESDLVVSETLVMTHLPGKDIDEKRETLEISKEKLLVAFKVYTLDDNTELFSKDITDFKLSFDSWNNNLEFKIMNEDIDLTSKEYMIRIEFKYTEFPKFSEDLNIHDELDLSK